MRYLCYLEDHEQFIEFRPNWDMANESAPRTIYLVPAEETPFRRPENQLQLQFSSSRPIERATQSC